MLPSPVYFQPIGKAFHQRIPNHQLLILWSLLSEWDLLLKKLVSVISPLTSVSTISWKDQVSSPGDLPSALENQFSAKALTNSQQEVAALGKMPVFAGCCTHATVHLKVFLHAAKWNDSWVVHAKDALPACTWVFACSLRKSDLSFLKPESRALDEDLSTKGDLNLVFTTFTRWFKLGLHYFHCYQTEGSCLQSKGIFETLIYCMM